KRLLLLPFLIGAYMVHAQQINETTGNTIVTSVNKPVIKVTLSGKITDAKTNEALPGASVYFADEKIGVVADASGKYVISNIPDGHHVIEISYSGYATIVEHIELSANTEKNYALSSVVTEQQAVIVTGVSNATSARKSPVPVTSLKRQALLQTPSTNIIDALGKIPGVSQLSTGPAISKPIIRGLGYNRVVTINEGARQEGQQWGDEHGIEIDELSIARAEVLKGPASLMYGSDAIAGVVNLITNVPVAEGTLKGNILSNYQSNSDLFALNANMAGNNKGFNWNAYGTFKKSGDYKNKYDGRVLNSRFNEKNFGGYVGVNKSWGFSHLIFSRFDQEIGLVEGDRDDATGKFLLYAGTPLEHIATDAELDSKDLFVPRQHIVHYKLISDNNFVIGKNRLKVNIGYQNNLRKEYGNPEDPSELELFFDLKTINYNLQWQLPKLKEWHTTIGVNGMRQSNENKGDEVLIPTYNLFDVGAFVYTQRFFKKATLSGGLRFDNRSINSKFFEENGDVKFNAFKKDFSNISGSIGISYEPVSYLTLKANVARGFRSPTLAELASNGAHEGTNRYEYGNNDLSSETSLQLDAGIDISYEHFNISLSAFYNRINDFIFYRKLQNAGGMDSTVEVDGEFIRAYQFDQHNAKLSGIEASFDLHPHPLDWLHFENTFSFVRGRFDDKVDGSDNLPLIPAPRWISELRANFNKAGKSLGNLYASFQADRTFDQDNAFTGFDTETATKGYTVLNAGLGADILAKKKTIFSLYFALNNISDKAYQNHLSRLKYSAENLVTGRQGVFNPGRNFSVKLNVPLNFK
ncbi:MAG TPA: TonB-dependent receptor, partial [Chitinophagaceae bacterium]|nr:TonB-dependent receptor [Chitinophagaceae bacterium]